MVAPSQQFFCRICNNTTGNKSYVAREMMYGYRDEFEYLHCAECGCLQIKQVPDNLSKYYPKDYYSFQKHLNANFLKSFFRHQRAKHFLYGKDIMGMLVSKIYDTDKYYTLLKKFKISFESEVLDVGCGEGNRLLKMSQEGFCNLTGIDPFIKDDILYKNGVRVFKKDISEINHQFDLVMLHHSFEHIPQPLLALKEVYRLLKPDKYALIRIPIASSFAWRKYGVNWVQLDAPRHLFLHTTNSIRILAERANLQLLDVIFDSTQFQFWGSEQYLRDIPLRAANSYAVNPKKSIFSRKQIKAFNAKALELNENNDGDSACFCLHKRKS